MGRPDFLCSSCGVNLGPNPWIGPPDRNGQLHTACGCYPVKEHKVNARPTKQELIDAVMASRQSVAEYLNSIGKVEAFATFSKDDIAGLIYTAHEAVQSNLSKKAGDAFASGFNDPIPF